MSNDDTRGVFDVRVVHHHIRRGETTREALQKYLDSLPDDAEEGVPTQVTFAGDGSQSGAKSKGA